ncbi:MAG: DNA mismatch endonuclease Vsr [Hydrogenophaga sp.]|nr:DNA mismatch endonuclease Vsr [Hydrogenophaga sp.]
MTDIVTAQKRSEMMSGIRGKNTRPELQVRKALFSMGYRFRLHRKDLPGRPDIVMPGRRIAILVHGCFWHGHQDCRYAKTPSTRTEFWAAKLKSNRQRDQRDIDALHAAGWRTLVVWECYLRSPLHADLATALRDWIEGDQQVSDFREPTTEKKASATAKRTSNTKTSSQ